MQTDKTDNKAAFWKKNNTNLPGSIQRVYGAMHPPYIDSKPSTPRREIGRVHQRTSSSSSFQDFQESTEDAWDIGDIDDEFTLLSDVKISPKISQSSALTVLSAHSSELSRSAPQLPMNNLDRVSRAMAQVKQPSQGMLVQRSNSERGSGIPGVAIRQMTPSLLERRYESSREPSRPDREAVRLRKFHSLLQGPNTDLDGLRELSWSGIPSSLRPIIWRLLAGYIPSHVDRREATLRRKREEYFNFVKKYYDTREEDIHQETYRQIHIDIPRMSPLVPLFQQEIVQQIFERILYIWAIRHPASGYVQGMNDLVTPFFVVFLHEAVSPGTEVESFPVARLDPELLRPLEADSFWCMSKLLDGIQDNYTFAQPGIQRQVNQLKDLTSRINCPLHDHLVMHNVEYLQFSFRWMNNLLMRELPLRCTIRLWDTYLSETEGFSSFHLYVCAAFLTYWSKELLRERDFQGLMLMLQNLPTLHWGNEEISLLLADAYRLKFTFADAPNHLQPK